MPSRPVSKRTFGCFIETFCACCAGNSYLLLRVRSSGDSVSETGKVLTKRRFFGATLLERSMGPENKPPVDKLSSCRSLGNGTVRILLVHFTHVRFEA